MTPAKSWLAVLAILGLMVAGLWLVSDQLRSSWILFGAHPEVVKRLESSLETHRDAARDGPTQDRERARQEFERTNRLLQRLRILELSRDSMLHRFRLGLLVVLVAVVAFVVAALTLRQRRNRRRLAHLETVLAEALRSERAVDVADSSNDLLGRIGRTISRLSAQTAGERRRRKALELLRHWQEGARVVAHEMKTPLTSLRLDLASLEKSDLSSTQLETVERARTGLETIEDFVARYTAMARLPVPRPRADRLDDFARSFVAHFADAWPGVSLLYEGSKPESSVCLFDPDVTRRVLHNLCENAVNAMSGEPPARSEEPSIRLRLETGTDSVDLFLEDDGPGVPPEVRSTLFAPYVSRSAGGRLGIGLALSRKMMVDQGGDLSLMPSTRGACFRLEFVRPEAGATSDAEDAP